MVDMNQKLFEYYERVTQNQQDILDHELEKIEEAARIIAKALKNGNKVWGHGPGHANEFIQTMMCTPAGIPFISSMVTPLREIIHDNVEGLGLLYAKQTPFRKGDILFYVSISGKHTMPIEIVEYVKTLGVFTIGLTSVEYSNSSKPNNKWGKRLYEVVDIFFDNHVKIGDACVTIEGAPDTVAPVSGVMSMFIAELLNASLADELEKLDVTVPIFRHPNIKGSDTHNEDLIKNCNWVNYFYNMRGQNEIQ